MELVGKEPEAQAALRQVHWSSARISNLLASRDLEHATRTADRTASVLDSLAVLLRHDNLQQALFDTTNYLSQRFECSRVAIGMANGWKLKLTALSETAHFDRNTALSKAYLAAMEETRDVGKTLLFPPAATTPEQPSPVPPPLHGQLARESGAGHICSCPLLDGVTFVGVITLERNADAPFTAADTDWLEAFAALAAPMIRHRREAARHSPARLLDEGRSLLHKLFGPGHLIWKPPPRCC